MREGWSEGVKNSEQGPSPGKGVGAEMEKIQT